VRVQDCAYLADDPAKDFIGPRELGMQTVRVKRALAHPLQARGVFPNSHEADEVLDSLKSAPGVLLPLGDV
jgi:FMN phosphatase YigB (HAD superfamily)